MSPINPDVKHQILALDIGTGYVKACFGEHNKISFPSLYGYRESLEDEKKGIIEAVGHDVLHLLPYPTHNIVRAVSEGMPVNEKAFKIMLKEAVRRLKIKESDMPGIHTIIGIPYSSRSQKEVLRNLVITTLKPLSCLVVSQSLGTLVHEGKYTGIVISIGQGTTEIVYYHNRKPVEGKSLSKAVDFLLLGKDKLDYLNHGEVAEQRVRTLADLIADELNNLSSQLHKTPEVIISGGGVMIEGMLRAIQARVKNIVLLDSKNPVYSNVLGLHMLLESIRTQNPQGHQTPTCP